MFDRIKSWYESGKWTDAQVTAAVGKGWLTQDQADQILSVE